ncbi:peroxiredoxin-5, mitochondrial-like [Athalia rosae]|uniref:peroxiredoxin-5, mitochondrial-like n=1 Tax=Athalia rosae TaxID=37344 RepID=UPI00203486CA|nr:peroxiredoxin-5, mitochondrial-like [Athalia rosae]XP_048510914.1 peroxiredoxin-5, mitochondrial-like [Athalia rosae]
MSEIKIGDKIPSLILYEEIPEKETDISELVADKKAIIFGVPGAFVPGCSRVHLRGFIEKSDELRRKGYEEIICVSVNDPFVLTAWGWSKGAEDRVRLLADPMAKFTSAIGMGRKMPELGEVCRSRRYSMVTINGIVRELFTEEDNARLMCLGPKFCI